MTDWVIQYDEGMRNFRIDDGEGTVSDVQPVPGDGIALVEFPGEDEEDMVFLVTLQNYIGECMEANTVYDVDATETEVEEGVDFSKVEEEEEDDES